MSQKNKRAIGIQVNSGGSVNVSGDIVGRDKINKTTYSYRTNFVDLTSWQETMLGEIKKGEYSTEKKKELKKQIELIKSSIEKDKTKNLRKLEKLINTLALMSKDIFEVAVATLVNPLAGIGLALKKIGDKARIEIEAR